jgi:murein DD-endopeptidase MepM/ murein hydrolase activator NlpD
MADSFDKLLTQLREAEKLVAKMVEESAKFSKNMNGATVGGGKASKNGGQKNNGSGNSNAMPTSHGAFSDTGSMPSQGELSKVGSMGRGMGKLLGYGQYERSGAEGPIGKDQFEKVQQRQELMKSASRMRQGLMGNKNYERYSKLGPEAQANISSSMYSISDAFSLYRGIQNSVNTFLPDVQGTMNYASSYYNASLYGGNRIGRNDLQNKTFGTLSKMNAITSAGSDAYVAQYLAQKGMSPNSAAYQTTLSTVGNAARYMNISNEDAVGAVEGLTNAKGAATMLQNFGIYTADLSTGKEKSQGQIFGELAGRLTAGRGQADAEQTMASIRRGALGRTIDAFFGEGTQEAQMFKQYMIDHAKGGNNVDLSSSTDVTAATTGANANPLASQMEQYTGETGALKEAQDSYITGIGRAVGALNVLNATAGSLSKTLGGASAMLQTLSGNDRVKGMVGGISTAIDFTSKGIAGIGTALMGMDALNPAPALIEAGIIAGSMGAGLGIATGAAGVTAIMGGFGGSPAGSSGVGGSSGIGVGGGTSAGLFDMSDLGSHTVTQRLGNTSSLYGGKNGSSSDTGTHGGTDYAYAYGDAVKSVGDGIVANAKNDHPQQDQTKTFSLGNFVIINHQGEPTGGAQGWAGDGKYTSVYAHLSRVVVAVGDQVTKGQIIGYAGNSGYTRDGNGKTAKQNGIPNSGTHLHFEMHQGWHSTNGKGTSISPEQAASLNLSSSAGGVVPAAVSGTSGSTPGAAPVGTAAAMTGSTPPEVASLSSMMTPSAGLSASMELMKGFYSGNENTILASIQGMAINQAAAAQAGASKPGGSYAPVSAGNVAPPTTKGTTNNNVSITVQVPDVTAGDATKFAQLVKQYLDDNSLLSNTGNR